MSFKKCKVVMLPTNEKALGQTLWLSKSGQLLHTHSSAPQNLNAQHLYFLSDEEIKVGDWILHNLDKKPIQWNGEETESNPSVYGYKKIIATTDKSIILPERFPSFTYLPQPSQPFIEKFVEEYNKGNVITEVMVEWEYNSYSTKTNGELTADLKLKINPDNTINISKSKKSWNREEVVELLYKHTEYMLSGKKDTLDKWIEENL